MELVFVDDPPKMYSVPMSEGKSAKFMQPGDTVTIQYVETGDGELL